MVHSNLVSACAKHTLYTETDRHDVHGGTPVLVKNGETNMAVAIDVRVDRDVVTYKHHLRGGGILIVSVSPKSRSRERCVLCIQNMLAPDVHVHYNFPPVDFTHACGARFQSNCTVT